MSQLAPVQQQYNNLKIGTCWYCNIAKNFYKCHNVLPPSTTTKENKCICHGLPTLVRATINNSLLISLINSLIRLSQVQSNHSLVSGRVIKYQCQS
jgi:hypothetical protein